MKVRIESETGYCEVGEESADHISQVAQLIRQCLVGYGYHPDNVSGIIKDDTQ